MAANNGVEWHVTDVDQKRKVITLDPKEDLYMHLQDLPLCHPKHREEPVKEIKGPDSKEEGFSFEDVFYGRTISTYPVNSMTDQREGDPICDCFGFQAYPDGSAVLCVADGCNWGEKPKEAAVRSRDCFLKYMKNRRHKLKSTQDLGHYLLRAFSKAQEEIVRDKETPQDAGTTTLVGGMVIPVDMVQLREKVGKGKKATRGISPVINIGRRGKKDDQQKWIFMCASVGDCKAFRCNQKKSQFDDLCMYFKEGEMANQRSHNDPGGRLGAYIGGCPDLRNLRIYASEIHPGDMLLVTSDGVYDNLDARHLGMQPKELKGLEEYGEDWFKLPDTRKVHDITWKWLSQHFFDILKHAEKEKSREKNEELGLESVVETLLSHALKTTESSRSFMREFPHKRLPKDYKTYQGKMDHTTCIAFQIPAKHFRLPEELSSYKRSSTSDKMKPSGSSSSSSGHGTHLKPVKHSSDSHLPLYSEKAGELLPRVRIDDYWSSSTGDEKGSDSEEEKLEKGKEKYVEVPGGAEKKLLCEGEDSLKVGTPEGMPVESGNTGKKKGSPKQMASDRLEDIEQNVDSESCSDGGSEDDEGDKNASGSDDDEDEDED